MNEKSKSKNRPPYFSPRRLGHANLFVSDYERAAEFYTSVVGFEEVYRQPDNKAAFLSNGNTYHDLALTDIRSKYSASEQQPGLWHLAFELETEAEMVDGYNRARDDEVDFSFVMDHDVARSLYQNDPDGNLVEIYADVEKDWRAMRQGIIVKEKPKWVPGVTSKPLTEKCYPQDPHFSRVEGAIFHPKKVTHVALVTQNFEAMFDNYTDLVGLTAMVGDRGSQLTVLKGEASTGDLTLYRANSRLTPGLHHVGFEVWNEHDLNASIAALPGSGVRVESVIDHPIRHSVVIQDPDGLRLQFFVNRDWSPAAITEAGRGDDAAYLL